MVTSVVPGALLFLTLYQLHARSYIKNSQLTFARRLSDRNDRLTAEYLNPGNGQATPKAPAATQVGADDLDLYVGFLYNTTVKTAPSPDRASATGDQASDSATKKPVWQGINERVLSFLEDYFPYYSEASVEWRELLHDVADDNTWESRGTAGIEDVEIVFTSKTGSLPVQLTSWVPSITHVPPTRPAMNLSARLDKDQSGGASQAQAVPTTGSTQGVFGERGEGRSEKGTRASASILLFAGVTLLGLAWSVVQILNRRIYLVGITEPLWACGQLTVNAGENVLVLCDRPSKASQISGITPLKLGPIVQERDITGAWRRALLALDERAEDGAVLIDDFDDGLEDTVGMDHKLALLEELVSDQSRTVIVVSQVSLRGLTDSLRHSAHVISAARQKRKSGQKPTSTEASETTLERWRRVLRAFVVVERRGQDENCPLDHPGHLLRRHWSPRRKSVPHWRCPSVRSPGPTESMNCGRDRWLPFLCRKAARIRTSAECANTFGGPTTSRMGASRVGRRLTKSRSGPRTSTVDCGRHARRMRKLSWATSRGTGWPTGRCEVL